MRDLLKPVSAYQCTFCGDLMLDCEEMDGVCEERGCPARLEHIKRKARASALNELQRLGQEWDNEPPKEPTTNG